MDQPLKLLVVDDDEVDRMAVGRALRAAGLQLNIAEVADEAGAIAALADQPFDCAFLDYQLAAGDGLAVLREVRSRGVKTPIVMLTGQSDELLAVEIMKAGAADYLPKSRLSADGLAQSLRRALRLREAEREAERASDALRFLAEASAMLSASLDYETTIGSVARLAVPLLADYCAVDVVEADGALRRVAAVHQSEAEATIVRTLLERYPPGPDGASGFPKVIRTGEPDMMAVVPDNFMVGHAQDDGHLALLRELRFSSYLCVPLPARGRVLGAMTLVMTQSGRHYGAEALELAQELARRAAAAVDNALLYQEARDALRSRDAFLSIASHELKTPLTTLHGYAELMLRRAQREQTLPDREQRQLRVIAEQALRLNRMIESLLDISRLESGQLSIEQVPVDLCALANRLAEEVEGTLHHHTLRLDCAERPVVILGDALRLEQVLQNLLQNATKYSPSGGEITLRVEQRAGRGLLSVSDQGIGIPAEAIPQLFHRFYRVESSGTQGITGLGLGLFVVKEIVSLHQGALDVESQEGQGSTFTVSLPLWNAASGEENDNEPKTKDHPAGGAATRANRLRGRSAAGRRD